MNAAESYVLKNMMSGEQFIAFQRTIAVIDSCETTNHWWVSFRYLQLAKVKYHFPRDVVDKLHKQLKLFKINKSIDT